MSASWLIVHDTAAADEYEDELRREVWDGHPLNQLLAHAVAVRPTRRAR